MIVLKKGVSLDGLSAEMLRGMYSLQSVAHKFAVPLVITSTTEGKHSAKRSAHYRGDAIDIRTRDLHAQHVIKSKENYTKAVQKKLAKHFVVILEKDHIHIHWGPVHV